MKAVPKRKIGTVFLSAASNVQFIPKNVSFVLFLEKVN